MRQTVRLAVLALLLLTLSIDAAPADEARVTVTNIDVAGDIESWRGPGRCDVRIMKDTYPPRIDLSFRLLVDWLRHEPGRGTRS